MKLSQFSFTLPENLIAQDPSKNRGDSKLMILNRAERSITHKHFKDILDIFNEDDVFVINNTKVFSARMFGNKEKTGAQIEVFLLRQLNEEYNLWDVLVDPARKIRVGNKLYFGDDELVAEVVDNTTSRGRTIRFLFDGDKEEFSNIINKLGETPIPKYIKRGVKKEDVERFQTIFAKDEGAIAPPTAGLHFSRELMMRLDIKGIKFAEITLHLGLGAAKNVEVEDLTKHKMDSESYTISEESAKVINEARASNKRVLAVGTSVMRALESSVSSSGTLNASSGWTDKFLFPPHDFSIANSYLTNFHSPQSTLFMSASAFGDYDFMKEAYAEAIKKKYHFLCYGDAMLII